MPWEKLTLQTGAYYTPPGHPDAHYCRWCSCWYDAQGKWQTQQVPENAAYAICAACQKVQDCNRGMILTYESIRLICDRLKTLTNDRSFADFLNHLNRFEKLSLAFKRWDIEERRVKRIFSQAWDLAGTFINRIEVLVGRIESRENSVSKLEQLKTDGLDNRSVNEVGWSVRVRNVFEKANITTLGQLVQKTPTQLMKYRNFGKMSLREVIFELGHIGLHLASEESLDKTK